MSQHINRRVLLYYIVKLFKTAPATDSNEQCTNVLQTVISRQTAYYDNNMTT